MRIECEHKYIENNMIPDTCRICFKVLSNVKISKRVKRSDWEWLCRKCHMVKDGRINNLKQFKVNEYK